MRTAHAAGAGEVMNPSGLPQSADVPRTAVPFTETADAIGPPAAESMSESPFNPVAPAPANALRDATGPGFTEVPLPHDRVRREPGRHGGGRRPPGSPRSR